VTRVLSIDDLATYWRERAEQAGELQHLALGDSLAQGYGVSAPEHGYVGRLAALIAAAPRTPVRDSNLRVCGARVRQLVDEQLPAADVLRRRSVVEATEGLVPVRIEAATAGIQIGEFGDGFAHPDDRGYQHYTAAFWSAIAPTL
jgi:lysophospholipase L1-like esterase